MEVGWEQHFEGRFSGAVLPVDATPDTLTVPSLDQNGLDGDPEKLLLVARLGGWGKPDRTNVPANGLDLPPLLVREVVSDSILASGSASAFHLLNALRQSLDLTFQHLTNSATVRSTGGVQRAQTIELFAKSTKLMLMSCTGSPLLATPLFPEATYLWNGRPL